MSSVHGFELEDPSAALRSRSRGSWIRPFCVLILSCAVVATGVKILQLCVLAYGDRQRDVAVSDTTRPNSSQRAAIVLSGLYYQSNYVHWTQKENLTIDYRWSLKNYQEHIFNYFHKLGFATDVFFCAQSSSLDSSLVDDYKPKRYLFVNDSIDSHALSPRLKKQRTAIKLALDYEEQRSVGYSRLILTRFDLIFQQDFATSNIQWDKLNLVSKLAEGGDAIDDNFYAMPFGKLRAFDSVIGMLERTKHHPRYALERFEAIAPVNFIKNERVPVRNLSWFYIVRNSTKGIAKSSGEGEKTREKAWSRRRYKNSCIKDLVVSTCIDQETTCFALCTTPQLDIVCAGLGLVKSTNKSCADLQHVCPSEAAKTALQEFVRTRVPEATQNAVSAALDPLTVHVKKVGLGKRRYCPLDISNTHVEANGDEKEQA